ncbi:MAG: TIGR04282 family arsenosugar biosynthesis glycosyltransferase, partial [Synechococcaceae cyanobacterium]
EIRQAGSAVQPSPGPGRVGFLQRPVRIVILAKAPRPGAVKTRLEPALGAAGAARLAERLLRRTIGTACASGQGVVEVCASPGPDDPAWRRLSWPPELAWSEQSGGDLGERMAAVARRVLASGANLLLLGMDCAELDAHHLQTAAAQLCGADAALIPSLDGGYVLLGLRRFHPALFRAVPWSTGAVCAITRERLRTLGWSWREQCPLADLDEPVDLDRLPQAIRLQLAIGHDPGSPATSGRPGPPGQHSGGDPGAG